MNKNHNYNPDAIPVPEQGTASYKGIHQLYKNIPNVNNHEHIFPVTYTQSVYDGKTGANLEHILHQFNHIFLQFQGTAQATRNLLPKDMRRKGIMISYRDMDDTMITERNIDESESTSNNWGLDKYWERFEGYNLGDLNDMLEQIINEFKQTIQDMITNVQNQINELLQQIENDANEDITNILNNLQQQIDEILNNIKGDIQDYVQNIFDQYINGDEFKNKLESIAGDIINNYLDENLEPIVGQYFDAIVAYLRDNERVIANALARHEQAITDLQNAEATT